jgi:predicted PurR-regulated permease PerM
MSSRTRLFRDATTATLAVVLVLGGMYLLYLLRQPIGWLILAAFLAVAMSAPVTWLSGRMRKGWAIAVSYLGLLLVPALLVAMIVPPVVNAVSDLIHELPRYAQDAQDAVRDNPTLRGWDEDFGVTQRIQEEAAKLPARAGDAAGLLGDVGLGFVNSAFAAITILIMSIFLVANGGRWVRGLLGTQPVTRRQRLAPLLDRMRAAVANYIVGALAQAVIAGVLSFVVLLAIGAPFPAALAVIIAVFDLIPMVGATIGAVLVGIVTLFASFPIATIVWVIWSVVYQQIENTVIQPRIQERAVGVHPLAVIAAVLFASQLFGVAGALLAVPIAAMIQIAIRDWWLWRRTRAEVVAP